MYYWIAMMLDWRYDSYLTRREVQLKLLSAAIANISESE
jgi:hypothetical protein